MISKNHVAVSIDRAEERFKLCWIDLMRLKEGAEADETRTGLLDFQGRLAEALFGLDETYRQIKQEERITIGRRARLHRKWFRQRLSTLAKYREAIGDAIDIGRSLGDAFAWLLYNRNRDLLLEHSREQLQRHTPPGVGGRGELEFIKQMPWQDGHLVVYHGITTILRIGDVSFVETQGLRVPALGELKTQHDGADSIVVTLNLTGRSNAPLFRRKAYAPLATSLEAMPERMELTLRKQLHKMVAAGKRRRRSGGHDFFNGYHVPEFRAFLDSLEGKAVAYQQVGKGLLLAGIRTPPTDTLSARLMSKASKYVHTRVTNVARHVLPLMDPTTRENEVWTNRIDGGMSFGATPLAWWPFENESLRQIYFREVLITTMYNPLHLVRELRARGFTVERSKPAPGFEVTWKRGRKLGRIGEVGFFFGLVQTHLLRENTVADTLQAAKQLAKRRPGRTNLDLVQHLI